MAQSKTTQRRRGVLRGPSPGWRAWTAYWIDVANWLIDARRRWHEADVACHGGGRRLASMTAIGAILCVVVRSVLG